MTEPDPFEVSLEDTELLAEVQLLTDLIVAASHVEDSLHQQHVDEVLGIIPRRVTDG
jgi:hypothetical protein